MVYAHAYAYAAGAPRSIFCSEKKEQKSYQGPTRLEPMRDQCVPRMSCSVLLQLQAVEWIEAGRVGVDMFCRPTAKVVNPDGKQNMKKLRSHICYVGRQIYRMPSVPRHPQPTHAHRMRTLLNCRVLHERSDGARSPPRACYRHPYKYVNHAIVLATLCSHYVLRIRRKKPLQGVTSLGFTSFITRGGFLSQGGI